MYYSGIISLLCALFILFLQTHHTTIRVNQYYHCTVRKSIQTYRSCLFEKDEHYKEYEYVYRIFRNKQLYPKCRKTTDPLYPIIPITVNEKRLKYGKRICTKTTFVVAMIVINTMDVKRRMLLRQYYKQGMKIYGLKLNYFFIVAVAEKNSTLREIIEKENAKYGDIVISLHVDSYHNVTMTCLDGFLYIRNHCKHTKYVARVDADTFIPLGNMIAYLKASPRTMFYGGKYLAWEYPFTGQAKHPFFVPKDFKGSKVFGYIIGGTNFYSYDVIPFINIGCYFSPIIHPAAEDALVGLILKMAGVPLSGLRSYLYVDKPNEMLGMNLDLWPNNVLVMHNVKNCTIQKAIYYHYRNTYTCYHYLCKNS